MHKHVQHSLKAHLLSSYDMQRKEAQMGNSHVCTDKEQQSYPLVAQSKQHPANLEMAYLAKKRKRNQFWLQVDSHDVWLPTGASLV
jgi:hypothetical protein